MLKVYSVLKTIKYEPTKSQIVTVMAAVVPNRLQATLSVGRSIFRCSVKLNGAALVLLRRNA